MPPGIPEAYIPLADAIAAHMLKKRPPVPKLAGQCVKEVQACPSLTVRAVNMLNKEQTKPKSIQGSY